MANELDRTHQAPVTDRQMLSVESGGTRAEIPFSSYSLHCTDKPRVFTGRGDTA
jgi:hypothetical protein